MNKLRLIIVFLFFNLCGTAQTQDYLSYKNITTAKGEVKMTPIVSIETKRISFVPVLNQVNKKALLVGPDNGIDGIFSLVLEKVDHITNDGLSRSVYYDALEKDQKRIVIVTTENSVLISVSVIIKFEKNIFTTLYTNIKPVYREF